MAGKKYSMHNSKANEMKLEQVAILWWVRGNCDEQGLVRPVGLHGCGDRNEGTAPPEAHLCHQSLDVAAVKGVYSLRLSMVVKVDQEHVVASRCLQPPSRLPP